MARLFDTSLGGWEAAVSAGDRGGGDADPPDGPGGAHPGAKMIVAEDGSLVAQDELFARGAVGATAAGGAGGAPGLRRRGIAHFGLLQKKFHAVVSRGFRNTSETPVKSPCEISPVKVHLTHSSPPDPAPAADHAEVVLVREDESLTASFADTVDAEDRLRASGGGPSARSTASASSPQKPRRAKQPASGYGLKALALQLRLCEVERGGQRVKNYGQNGGQMG